LTPGETPVPVPLSRLELPPGANPSVLNTMPHPPEHKLRWYQYKLSSLFVLTILVALACGWYLVQRQKAAKRRSRNMRKIVASFDSVRV
jgi:hypothetical protein